jgi:hypothetical protein
VGSYSTSHAIILSCRASWLENRNTCPFFYRKRSPVSDADVAVYFFDSSALAKRYVQEVGTSWVRRLTCQVASNHIYLARITVVEMTAAIASTSAPFLRSVKLERVQPTQVSLCGKPTMTIRQL